MVVTKVKNSLNATAFPCAKRKFTLPSLTVPDQTMSIREIMDRFARGLPVDGEKVPMYDEDNDLPNPLELDLAEREELAEAFKAEIADVQRRRASQRSKGRDSGHTARTPMKAKSTSTDAAGSVGNDDEGGGSDGDGRSGSTSEG